MAFPIAAQTGLQCASAVSAATNFASAAQLRPTPRLSNAFCGYSIAISSDTILLPYELLTALLDASRSFCDPACLSPGLANTLQREDHVAGSWGTAIWQSRAGRFGGGFPRVAFAPRGRHLWVFVAALRPLFFPHHALATPHHGTIPSRPTRIISLVHG